MVDASQGVEAQTLANAYLTVDNALEVIPVINKIDLPSAQPDECKRRIEDIIGLDAWTAILASAKDPPACATSSRRSSNARAVQPIPISSFRNLTPYFQAR